MDKILVVRANLGGFDNRLEDEKQSMNCDSITITDKESSPRYGAMTPRLQAKIPKCFAWQIAPGYDFYLWADGNIKLKTAAVSYLHDNLKDHDVVVLQHPQRNTIWWEYRYNWRGLHSNAPSNYLTERYDCEFLDEQMEVIKADKDYRDDLLVNGGVFMYRNTPEVQQMLKEWWYHISRYLIMDQMSWAYVLKKSGLRVNVLPDKYDDCSWLQVERHRLHG